MPFDGSGNYTPSPGPNFPAVTGTSIVAAYYNNVINDISVALNNCLTRDGQGKPSASINWNAQNITNIGTINGITLASGAALVTDTDGTLAANSDAKVSTQKAVKTYVDTIVTSVLKFKGSTNCSGNPNYPVAVKGDLYIVSVAGKIGGAAGISVDIGDQYFATADNAGGTQAAVGASWTILEHNLVGALLTSNNLSELTATAATARTNIGAKANTPQIQTVASAATVTPTFANDQVNITALAVACQLLNPTGTALDGWGIVVRIKDNGTGRALTYDTQYRALGTVLPTSTIAGKTHYLAMLFNAADTKWDVIAVRQEA